MMKPTGMAMAMAMVAGLGLLSAGRLASAEDSAAGKSDPLADAKLELKVEGRLTQDEQLSQQAVIVEADKGVLTLTGTVVTAADRVRVEEMARSAGAGKIDNRLTLVSDADADTDADKARPSGDREPKAASPAKDDQNGRAALSDPRRRDPLVGAMPADQTGSREVRMRTTGMPDPVLEKREAEERQKKTQPTPSQRRPAREANP